MIEFDNFLSPGRRGHLVGIGGVSMSSLAEVLQDMGICVTGSDMNESRNVLSLREHGINVFIGHRAENITDEVEFLVRTAAVHDDNPEIAEAHRRGIPVFERTQAWGAISKDYQNGRGPGPHRHDRRHAAAAPLRPPHRSRQHDHHGGL